MKHTGMKRFGAILLALCLLMGMLPTSALAADTPEEAAPKAKTKAAAAEELPSWWNDVPESAHQYFWNYNMSIVNQPGTGAASQIRHYFGKDLSGNGKPAYLNYNDMTAGMGNFEWGLDFDAVNDKKFYFRWIGVEERDNFKKSDIIYVPFSAEVTVPAYTEYEILWEFELKTTRNSKGKAGFYAEVFSWGEEFPAANSLKFMTGDTNQASPNALTLSSGARVYADADGQSGTVKVRAKYSNGTNQPKTFTPKFGLLSGVGESDALTSAYHHKLRGSTHITATCLDRPYNEPVARVDGVDYQDIGKAVEAFNLSSRETSTFELLKDVTLVGVQKENPPFYTLTHSGVVNMNGKFWEMGGLTVKPAGGKAPSLQFEGGTLRWTGPAATFLSNEGCSVTLDGMTMEAYFDFSHRTNIYTTGGQVTLRNSNLNYVYDGILAAGGTVTLENSRVETYTGKWSAVRTAGNAEIQISNSELISYGGATANLTGGGTLKLSGNTTLSSMEKYPQIDLGGSGKLDCSGMSKPAEPYRLRAEFDAGTGFRVFTQNWSKTPGRALTDYFVNKIADDNHSEVKIIPGGHFAEKNSEAAIQSNSVTFNAGDGKIGETGKQTVTLYTDMAGKLSELPTAALTGRTFAGWYSADGEYRYGSNTVFSEPATAAHAVWGEAGIPVTLDYNKEGGITSEKRKVVLGKTYKEVFGEKEERPLPGAEKMTRNGYTFDGWYTAAEGGDEVTDDTKVINAESHTLYAHWKPNEYTLTIENLNGGALPQGAETSFTLTYGEAYPELPTPTKAGYSLNSWRNQYGTPIKAGETVDTTYDQTLSALWVLTVPTYNVTLVPGEGGSIANGLEPIHKVSGGKPYGSIPSARRSGYTFDGWWTQESGGERITSASIAPILDDAADAPTLYAHWIKNNYTVTFYDGYTVVDTLIVPAGDPIPEPEAPTKTGYSFNGWRTQRYGAGEPWDFNAPVTGNLSLFTYWTSHILTVYLNLGGGSLPVTASDRIGYDKLTDTVYGNKLPTPKPPDKTKEFLGWYTEEENGSLITAETALRMEDHTVYAHWGPKKYVVTLNPNGGECTEESVKAGEGNVLGALPVPTRRFSEFAGWFTAKTGGTEIKEGDTLTGDTTVYAQWSPITYAVRFDLGGGTLDATEKTVTPGSSFGVLPSPAKTGYRFTSWWYEPAGGEALYITESTPVPEIEGDTITLTAHWNPLKYTVTLNANGGAVSSSWVTAQSDLPYPELPTPTRTGYTFGGWYTAADDSGTKIETDSVFSQSSDQTLYAHWTVDTYTVNFNPGTDGSVNPASKSVTYGKTYEELPTPTMTGKTFVGWYTAESGGKQVTRNTPVEYVESKTIALYAHWRDTHQHPVEEGKGDVDFIGVDSLDKISAHATAHAAYFLEGNGPFSTDSTIKFYSNNSIPYTITICLNGKTITGPENAPVFSVGGGVTLEICDCQGGGVITLAEGGSGSVEGVIHECGDGLRLYGGTITGNKGGCGVYVNNGFWMHGGAITGNTAKPDAAADSQNNPDGNGGGVYMYGGKFVLYGGVISGNKAEGSGGGLGVRRGSLSDIYVRGGAITGNTATKGGGVYSYYNMEMTGGSISGNTAAESYGGVCSERGIDMNGGEITGNKAPKYGGFGVIPSQHVGESGWGGDALVLGGTAKIIGNTTTDGAASNLYLYAAQKDGGIEIKKLSVTIDTANLPEAGAQIGITTETAPCHQGPVDISKASSGDYSAYFVSDDPGCSVQNSGEGAAQVLQMVKYAPQHQHPFCGPDGCGLENHDSHSDLAYQPLGNEMPTDWRDSYNHQITLPAGNYFLTEDITLEYTLKIPADATVNLCLNGHTITGPNGSTGISTPSSVTLRLCDCVGGGKITHGAENPGIGVSNSGTFELYSGEISGNSTGVKSSGTFTMYSGSISGNTTHGVNNSSGTFDLYGGVISGNGSSTSGGGVNNSGAFTMHDGLISGNTTTEYGGGVYVKADKSFTMRGGVISGNESSREGGGVYSSSGSVTIEGGEITGNSAVRGGGLAVCGTAAIQGGRITGNTASTSGGGVYHVNVVLRYGGKLTVSGNTVVSGNTLTGGTASNVYFYGNEYETIDSLSKSTQIAIGAGGLGAEASIGVGGQLYEKGDYQGRRNFAAGPEFSTYADRFFCDDEANSSWVDGDYLWLGANPPHSHAVAPGGASQVFRDLTSAPSWALDPGQYCLTADLSANSFDVKGSAVVTLCLNGHTLTTKNSINVSSGATLIICDCQGGGKITRENTTSDGHKYAQVLVSGTLNLYGGTITGNNNTSTYSQYYPKDALGGGVRVEENGKFTMYGGAVTDNTVKYGPGGGVYVAQNGTFTMYDGEISGNTSSSTRAADGGGGVYVATGGTASLLGGVITDNKVTATSTTAGLGGGVYAGGSVTVGGLVYVQNNTKGTAPNETPNNVYLPTGQTIAVSGETSLEEGAKLGVTTQTAPTDSAAVDIITGDGTGLKDHFTSDNAEYGFQDGENGLQMIPDAGGSGGDDGGDDPSITPPENLPTSFTVIFAYPGSDGQTTTITLKTNDQGKLTGQTLPAPEREGYLFGGWYLDDDPVTANTVFKDSATVTAQWTLCDHTAAEKRVTTAATCSAEGQAQYACPCGASWTETIDILDHSWGRWTKKDEDQHTRTCSVGKETQTENHDWAEDTTRREEPTCTEEGKIVYACSVCGAEKTVTLPVTSHSYSDTWKSDGNGHWQVCSDCQIPTAAQKHLYTEKVTQEPTCDEAGVLTLTCSVCGYEAAEAVPALGHSFGSQWEKDANGHWHVCANDNTHTSEKLAHSWDGGMVLIPATTTSKGTTQYTCIDCGQTKEEQDIPMVVPVTYTLTYTPGANASGEDIMENDQTAGASVTLPACTFTRTGYTFTGWECGGSTYQAGDVFTVLPGDITFTAQWRLDLPITLQPGDTVVLEDGASVSRSDDGTAVTIRKNQVDVSNVPDGAEAQENTPETTVTVPADGTVTLKNDPVSKPGLDEDGNEITIQTDRTVLEIPGGSKVQTKSDDPEITIPEGATTAKVTMNGDVYDLPAGTTVTQGDSIITVGTSGGSVSTGGDVTFDDGEGQVTVQNGEEDPVSVTVPKDGGVSVTPDENTQRFGGTVADSDGNPVENATVELRQGNTVYGKAVTDSNGNYTFLSVYPGVYDLVVSENGRTLTKLVEITGEAPIGSVTLTDNASVLTIAEGTNLEVVVGGLDDEAQKGSITMTVEQKEEAEADGAKNIRDLAGAETVLDYLDVKVEKGGTILTETETVLEIILPFEFANVEGGVTVYRYHNGTAQPLTENETKGEGTFRADPANGMIRVYASKFSTYALGYAKPYAGPEVSVAPGETKEADDGTRVENKTDGTVTITYPGGGKINIVLPEGGDKTVILNRETGEVTVPEGSTVNTDPAVTLPQGGTVDKNGDITVPANGTVTITDGTNTTTITPPSGGAVTPGEEGGLHVPAGTAVQTGDGPVITLPENGEGGTVFPGGEVYGSPVKVGDATVTITDPSSGDMITSPDGEVTLPGGATVKPDGEIDLPKGGTVTQGETTVTVPTTGGTVGKEESGETTVPGGSTVQTGEAGKPITLPQGGKVDESGNVTGESVKVGDTTVTATDPDKPVTADPTGSTTIPAGAAAEVEQGGTTTTVTPGAGDDATVKPDGGIDLPAGGKVTIPGENGKPDTTVTVGESGGTITPDPDGTVEVPGGSAVQTGAGPVITLPESGGGGTVNKGGDVTVPIGGSATVTDKDGNETTVTPGADGNATVKPDGEIDLPAGGKVTVADGEGGTTEITAPAGGGTVSTDQNGNLVVPGGSTVTKPDGTTETVPEAGGVVKPDGTVEQKPTPPTPSAPSGGGTTYPPVIEQPRHGKVTVSPADPQSGDKVTITVTPEDGFEPRTVTITDSNGNPVKVTKNADGTYTYIQPEGIVTISVTMGLACSRNETCPLHAFTDATATAWYHDGVHYCVENGLMAGLGGSRFGPNNTLTRGMLAQILYNRENTPEVTGPNPFADVKEGAWYTDAVIWAAENDIVTGYGNGKYGPNDPITREQLATILWRYDGSPQSTGSLDQFTDGKEAGNYAVPALQWAVERKIVSGKGNGILDPKGKATRAEAASMLMRYCEGVE